MNASRQFPPSSLAADTGPQSNHPDHPPKGYIIAHINVTDLQRYALYKDIEEDAFTRFGGKFIIRGGEQHSLVGALKTRTIVIEFESLQVAMDCYNSLENQSAKAVRLAFSTADAVIVEGFSEP